MIRKILLPILSLRMTPATKLSHRMNEQIYQVNKTWLLKIQDNFRDFKPDDWNFELPKLLSHSNLESSCSSVIS